MYAEVVTPRPVVLRAVIYHRIEDRAGVHPALNPDLVSARPELFERQMRHLTRSYHPIGASELMAALTGKHTLPPRSVVVTFDDGYRDVVEVAWPILRQYRIPVILFVATSFVDNPALTFWWDTLWQVLSRTARQQVVLPGVVPRALQLRGGHERLAVARIVAEWLKQLSPAGRRSALASLVEQLGVTPEPTGAVLSWADLRKLDPATVTVAAHSRTHELLDQVDARVLQAEIEGSRDDVLRELGVSPPVFAYPNGNFNNAAIRALRRAGFQAAFTTVRGASVLSRTNPFTLRREDGRTSLLRFALKLTEPVAALRSRH
jgi:peptidoglycan/xylan/chitin deacetylase (PgdA/CDA1 family)